ncbi:hypothetical protein [Flavobacterium sp.]|uniref:hypothetical protein n=1 Tax=Flavobacterium sp. TaxID=239 RepID=UPI00261EEED5|nr:hypothetical protein [Flavobacterium sp.]
MENIEGLNDAEFEVLLNNIDELRDFMSDPNNVLLLQPHQVKRAEQMLNKK